MELIIAFVINILTSLVKNYVKPKFGDSGVQALVFILAVVGVFGWDYISKVPEWKTIVLGGLQTLAYAIAMYEIILKKIGFFEQKKIG